MTYVQAGDTLENPITGERSIVIQAPSDANGRRLITDVYVRPGGAVAGAHLHPTLEEAFTVLKGQVGIRLGERTLTATIGERMLCPAGTVHDWWNEGSEEAIIRVEVAPADRFIEMIVNLFGLAQDGKTNKKGMPNLFQLVLFAHEFRDVLSFVGGPPPLLMKAVTAVVAPLARWMGYRGSDPKYLERARKAQQHRATPESKPGQVPLAASQP